MAGSTEVAKEKSVTGAALEFRVRPVSYGLLSVLALSCGFHTLAAPDDVSDEFSSGRRPSARFGVAIWSNVPVDLPAASIMVGYGPAYSHLHLPQGCKAQIEEDHSPDCALLLCALVAGDGPSQFQAKGCFV